MIESTGSGGDGDSVGGRGSWGFEGLWGCFLKGLVIIVVIFFFFVVSSIFIHYLKMANFLL